MGLEVKFHSFLISALYCYQQPVSQTSRYATGKRDVGIYRTGGCFGSIVDLDIVENRDKSAVYDEQ